MPIPIVPVTISLMLKFPCSVLFRLAVAASVFVLSACTPAYDWREVRGTDAPFSVLLPAKPATYSRPINLDGIQLVMTMTAAEANGVTFAVGSAQLPASAKPQAALQAMKTALVNNIGGAIKHEKASAAGDGMPSIDIEATGKSTTAGGTQPALLFARFAAREQRIYQAVVIGREKAVSREAVDIFFTSLKLN